MRFAMTPISPKDLRVTMSKKATALINEKRKLNRSNDRFAEN